MADKSLLCTQKLRIPKPTPFGNKIFTPYQKYQMELQSNVRILSGKFPYEPFLKIKQLLEELNNDVQMVQDLLSSQNHKVETENKHNHVNKVQKHSTDEENKILKRTIASLYEKLKAAECKGKSLQEENEKLIKEKQFYKNRNKLLVEEQISQQFSQNFTIF